MKACLNLINEAKCWVQQEQLEPDAAALSEEVTGGSSCPLAPLWNKFLPLKMAPRSCGVNTPWRCKPKRFLRACCSNMADFLSLPLFWCQLCFRRSHKQWRRKLGVNHKSFEALLYMKKGKTSRREPSRNLCPQITLWIPLSGHFWWFLFVFFTSLIVWQKFPNKKMTVKYFHQLTDI